MTDTDRSEHPRRGRLLSLDGTWDFFPGDTADGSPSGLSGREPEAIRVPGLWEAQGRVELDGVAWYRTSFEVDDADGWWRLRLGAVMDSAQVWLNGAHVGGQELLPFTPLELDVTGVVRAGGNELAVRVDDPPSHDPRHLRYAHGKQGWANEVFPSPPSLYLTYGGIWQPVTLRRHDVVTVEDVFVDGDRRDLTVLVEVAHHGDEPWTGELSVAAAGLRQVRRVELAAREQLLLRVALGECDAPGWSPERPVLHEATATLADATGTRAERSVRFGLRRVSVRGGRLLLDGEPFRMRSALVQGFTAAGLYAEGSRAEVEAEVRAAREAGFNTLRLHIKAFDPVYLEVCDELGMLLHCDLPVAEPIAHGELGAAGEVGRSCVAAARAQVRRDRNHPSIVLWSAMNELGLGDPAGRASAGYEEFARELAATVRAADPTRPVIENDWVEPDPDRAFTGDVLTAHWYGRLQSPYLRRLDASVVGHAGLDRPLLVTEFGDWGLPQLDPRPNPPFWWPGGSLSADIASTPWPGSVPEFVAATQRYQGVSDRLQGEVLRRHDHVAGYCLTELTDVPHELNGLLDLERTPKPAAVEEVRRLNQPVLPMAALDALTVTAGEPFAVPLHVANDGPALAEVDVELLVDGQVRARVSAAQLSAQRAVALGPTEVAAPAQAGDAELVLRLLAAGRPVAENRYPLRVVRRPVAPPGPVRLLGDDAARAALSLLGAHADEDAPVLLVGEGALDPGSGRAAGAVLHGGGTVVVLAQAPGAAGSYPVSVELAPTRPEWGPTVFHFTTTTPMLPSLPTGRLLVTEHMSVEGTAVLTAVRGSPWTDVVGVAAYQPPPHPVRGTVVGELRVGRGRLVLCQLRLTQPALEGDAAALAVLADLLAWALPGRGTVPRARPAR